MHDMLYNFIIYNIPLNIQVWYLLEGPSAGTTFTALGVLVIVDNVSQYFYKFR